MISREEATSIIAERVRPITDVERIPLIEAAGRVLATPAVADIDTPPFNRATMDGYAVVAADGPGERPVIGYAPAGSSPHFTVAPGQVARIMTGAPMPAGADAVAQVERTGGYVEVGEMAHIHATLEAGTNVAPRGEDFRAGAEILSAPTLIGPAHIATLASVGVDPVTAFRRPTVAILATGDELVEPSATPGPGQIRNSNAYALAAQVKRAGGDPVMLGTATDAPGALAALIADGKRSDVLLVTGGVSAGDKDFVPATLTEAGYELLIRKVRIKPGKPMVFGVAAEGRYVFGLPGNPVSTFAIFELFIRPALMAMQGIGFTGLAEVTATMSYEHHRGNAEREEWVPVKITFGDDGYRIDSTGYHGSAHIHAVCGANAMILIPTGVTQLAVGSTVTARLLP